MPLYAVARGLKPGIYPTWDECKAQVSGFPNARYKKFNTREEAEKFIVENGGTISDSDAPPQKLAKKFDESSSGAKHANFGGRFQGSSSKQLDQKRFKNTGNASASSLEFQKDFSRKRARPSFDPKDFVIDEDGFVHVYTDGACESNGKKGAKAGIGVWFNDDHPLNISEPVKGRPTNNAGEIQAAIHAIEVASACGIEKLLVHTDSQFLINAATKWMNGWKRKGWKLADGTDVKNQEDFKVLDLAMKSLEVKWNYVPGHKGVHGNEKADELARRGAERYV